MKIVNFALNTLLVIILLSVAGFLIAPRFGLASQFEIKIVRSGSMSPTIPTGSVVFIQPETAYNVGDVITFGADTPTSIPTSHRIVSERTEGDTVYYTTKGDANNAADAGETAASKVIGRITFSLPYVGYILAFSKTQLGFSLLVLIPAALIILYELIGILKEIKILRKRKRDERAVQTLARESHRVRIVPNIPTLRPRVVRAATEMLHFDIETPIGWRERTAV